MKNKKILIASGIVVACVVLGVGIFMYQGKETTSDNVVYVASVESILNIGSGNGMQNRYSGIVESQEDWKLVKEENQEIEEILVKEGDEVTEGTPLVRYNIENLQAELSQAKLDLERISNDIANTSEQIKTLEKEKKSAGKDAQLDYTVRIQTAQTEIKKSEYEKKTKTATITKLEQSVNNATVTSKIAGVVKKINKGEQQGVFGEAPDNSLITILKTGDLRIKGTVNEQNIAMLSEGMELIIRSRVDENKTWKGTLTKIDREAPTAPNPNMVMGQEGGANQSSNYPFYVELKESQELMLGQHVYLELDMGQGEEKEGIWLDSYYIVDIDTKPYVWASTGKNKLEKKYVKLGEMDETTFKYKIEEGLKETDQITFPEEGLKEGMETKPGANGQLGQSNPAPVEGMEDMEGMEGTEGSGEVEMQGEQQTIPEDATMEGEMNKIPTTEGGGIE